MKTNPLIFVMPAEIRIFGTDSDSRSRKNDVGNFHATGRPIIHGSPAYISGRYIKAGVGKRNRRRYAGGRLSKNSLAVLVV